MQTPQNFTHPLDSSLPFVLFHFYNLGIYNIPHPDFRLDPLLLLHPICNCDSMWAHDGLEVGGILAIAASNTECAVNFFVWKLIPTINRSQKNLPSFENQKLLSQTIILRKYPQSPNPFIDKKQSHMLKFWKWPYSCLYI